jgi:hypothetical protein
VSSMVLVGGRSGKKHIVRLHSSTLRDFVSRHTASRQWSKDLCVCISAKRTLTYLILCFAIGANQFYSKPRFCLRVFYNQLKGLEGPSVVAHDVERKQRAAEELEMKESFDERRIKSRVSKYAQKVCMQNMYKG